MNYPSITDAELDADIASWHPAWLHPMRSCRHCGTAFLPQSGNQVFCSPTPEDRAAGRIRSRCNERWTTANARRTKTYERTMYDCICDGCGQEFSATIKARYCTTGHDSCEARAKTRDNGRPKRMSLGKGVSHPAGEPTTRDVARYKRTLRKDPCAYCGEASDAVDHIVPTNANGDNDWTNYTAACHRCNSTKSTLPMVLALLWIPASRIYHDLRNALKS